MTKTAIISVPRIEPHRPPTGAAIICEICRLQGHDVTAYDLNIEFYHHCKTKDINYYNFEAVWEGNTQLSDYETQVYAEFIDHWVNTIQKQQYDYVMISVFGFPGHEFTLKFLKKLRPATTAKIVCGGMGVSSVSLTDLNACFGQVLLDKKLIDCYIAGEGETALIDYLNGLTGPGINNNNPEQTADLDSLPFPNYSYFDLDRYEYLSAQRDVFITGSRGCVRKCTYCDVERYWPKYRYRSGQNIADEIIQNYERHGVTNFYFTDSLVNGSLKSFNDMCEKLAAYNFDNPISWQGQFIFRSIASTPKDHYAMIKAAGGDTFYVGVETGSDRVRFEMGKKFTNDDIDFHLEELSKNKLKVMFLMFTGYVTETLEDHQDNLKIFERWKRYVADGTIMGIELGQNLIVLPGSPVERMIDQYGMRFLLNKDNDPGIGLWEADVNPDLTIYERVCRKIEVHEEAIKNYWPVWRQSNRLLNLKNFVTQNNLHTDQPREFVRIVKEQDKKTIIPIQNITKNPQ
jgi:hypothetical protein